MRCSHLEIETKITKIGNTCYVLVPSFLSKHYCIENGDFVVIFAENDEILIKIPKKCKKNGI